MSEEQQIVVSTEPAVDAAVTETPEPEKVEPSPSAKAESSDESSKVVNGYLPQADEEQSETHQADTEPENLSQTDVTEEAQPEQTAAEDLLQTDVTEEAQPEQTAAEDLLQTDVTEETQPEQTAAENLLQTDVTEEAQPEQTAAEDLLQTDVTEETQPEQTAAEDLLQTDVTEDAQPEQTAAEDLLQTDVTEEPHPEQTDTAQDDVVEKGGVSSQAEDKTAEQTEVTDSSVPEANTQLDHAPTKSTNMATLPVDFNPKMRDFPTGGEFVEVPLEERVEKQSVPYKDDPVVRCSPMLKDGVLLDHIDPEVRTLHEVFLRGLKQSNGGPCVGRRPGMGKPYQWLTYQQVLDRAQSFGSGLIRLGSNPEPSQFIGIFAQNRVEWKIAEQTCSSFSMSLVTLYDTLGSESIQHIVTQCDLKYVIVDTSVKAMKLLSQVDKGKFSFKLLIIMDGLSPDVKKQAAHCKTKVMTFAEIEQLGKENMKDFVPPKPDDLHTICYTSGTTGLPKGVMLTHRNIVSNLAGVYGLGRETFLDMTSDDVYISYLPLAHVLERLLSAQIYFLGGSVGFFQGNIKLLMDDIGTLKPTVFPVVPRLLNRIYDKVWAGASESVIKKFLLRRALNSKLAKLQRGIVTRNTIWDKIVFKKIQESLGGRVKYCVTGAAPVSKEVINFMRASLGVVFSEGYGQTECSAAITLSLPGDYDSGSVGGPALCNLIKLVDVPEKNYYAKDGKGEICVKGPNVFVGYYKNEKKTREAIDTDGWLHTGDVGMWLDNGSLKIIDRKKHIFKLSQGEYIAPEKIEQTLVQSPAIAQVYVHGDSLKSTLVAIVVPDPEALVSWCSYRGQRGTYEELCASEAVKKLILDDVDAYGRLRGLHSFEIPKSIHLTSEMFSVENNLLTPTFKSKRPQIQAKYQEVIDKLYGPKN